MVHSLSSRSCGLSLPLREAFELAPVVLLNGEPIVGPYAVLILDVDTVLIPQWLDQNEAPAHDGLVELTVPGTQYSLRGILVPRKIDGVGGTVRSIAELILAPAIP